MAWWRSKDEFDAVLPAGGAGPAHIAAIAHRHLGADRRDQNRPSSEGVARLMVDALPGGHGDA